MNIGAHLRQSAGNINKILLIPLAFIVSLFAILAIGFFLEDPHKLPSVLINRPFPAFRLNDLHDAKRVLTEQDLKGKVSMVNLWATWCSNCLIEHPQLMRISREENVALYGINYHDQSNKARAWLNRHGNPFQFNIVDDEGKLGIDLGIYGAPETFVIDANGVIQYKHIGVISPALWDETLQPLIAHLNQLAGAQ